MNRTSIEWVKNPDGSQGYTWNPITGCLNHSKGLCRGGGFPCYAWRLANGRLKQRYLHSGGLIAERNYQAGLDDPFYPRFWPDKLDELRGKRQERGIFVCDMGDLFGIGVPEWVTERVMESIRLVPQHRFYLLTKQPQNLARWSPFPDNCWVGVTACTGEMYWAALRHLHGIDVGVKFLSIEPLLEAVIMGGKPYYGDAGDMTESGMLRACGIGWVIIGAQTKPKKLPEWEWIRGIIEAADNASIPIFLKNNLGLPRRDCEDAHRYYSEDMSGTMRLRQEMPE